MDEERFEAVIVGAGMAGVACAHALVEAGLKRACKGMPGTTDDYREDAQRAWLEAVRDR